MKKNSLRLMLCFLFIPLASSAAEADKLAPVKHIIVIYLENHSFDSLFGTFPGADGISNSKNKQTGPDGKPYKTLPPSNLPFPDNLPNEPFVITDYARYDQPLLDPKHRFYQIQTQINNGAMDKFAQATNVGGFVMGYYEEKNSPLWQYARKYTLTDHFFTAAFGGSLINHFWLICGCTPRYDNPPASLLTVLNEDGSVSKDGELTPDGYLANNIQPASEPYDHRKARTPDMQLPAQTLPTIGDRLNAANIDWAWYGGGWNDALKGNMASFVPHHQPFLYFKDYGENTEGRKHLKDEEDFLAAIAKGTLPAVSFYKPIGKYDFHPGYSAPKESEDHAFAIVQKIEKSPLFKNSVIIVTFDDSGGFYDHVAPPKRDRFGPGIRIPTLIISPLAKKGFIDHTTYDSTSILKLIEAKFNLAPLNDAYKNAGDLTNTLQ